MAERQARKNKIQYMLDQDAEIRKAMQDGDRDKIEGSRGIKRKIIYVYDDEEKKADQAADGSKRSV